MVLSMGSKKSRCSVLASSFAALLAAQLQHPLAAQQKAPTRSECEKAIRAFIVAEPGERDALEAKLFETLARVEPLSKKDAAAWRKKILDYHKKGRRLERGGRNWFDEKEKRGLYLVGGETKRPKGLVFGLHGGGAGSGDAGSAFGAYQSAANKFDWALVCPEVLVKSEHGWTTDGTEEWVLELMDCAMRTFKVDPDHVYFAGHSMGGYGSWTLGAHHADRIAAIVPSAGAPTPIFDIRDKTKLIDIEAGVIPSLRNVRAVIFQSTDDPRVPPAPNQFAVELLKQAQEKWGGYDFEYIEVTDRGHGFPEEGIEWLLEKVTKSSRNAVPERITWQPKLSWKRQFYWLRWDKPVLESIVVADLDRKANQIHIRCDKDPAGLQVLLDDRVLDLSKECVVTINSEEAWRGVPERRLRTIVRTSIHPDANLQFECAVPPLP